MSNFLHSKKQFNFYDSYSLVLKLQLFSKPDKFFLCAIGLNSLSLRLGDLFSLALPPVLFHFIFLCE